MEERFTKEEQFLYHSTSEYIATSSIVKNLQNTIFNIHPQITSHRRKITVFIFKYLDTTKYIMLQQPYSSS